MSKKAIFILLLMAIYSAALYTYSYSVKCRVCIETGNRTSIPRIAWRDFGTPVVHKDGKSYATYKCAAGHKYLVELGDVNE